MKKQKTFLALIATAAVTILTLAACKSKSNDSGDAAIEQTEQAEMVSPQQTLIVKEQPTSLMMKYGGKDEAIRQMPKVKWQTSDGSTFAELGKVITISGILDPKTGTVSVRAAFPNQKKMLVSGATGNILMSTTLPHAIVIPQTAVSELQDKMIVYKVVDGKAKMQTITVNPINDGKNYVVTSGLKVGDRIKK